MINGREIKEARDELGWSQTRLIAELRALAAQRGFHMPGAESLRVMVSRWENGHCRPDEFNGHLLCAALHLPCREAAAGEETSIRTDESAVGPSSGDGALADALLNITNRLRAVDRAFGARAARPKTSEFVSKLARRRQESSGADRRLLARAESDTAALAAWQALDLGDIRSANALYLQSWQAAEESKDSALIAHAMGEHSIMLAEIGDAELGLKRAHAASELSQLPPLLRSWLAATQAQVASHCRGEEETAYRSLRRAELWMKRATVAEHADIPFIIHSPAHLSRWTGHILARLRDPTAGMISATALQELPPDFARARAGQYLDLAEAAVNCRQADEVRQRLQKAEKQISQVGSVRLRKRYQLLTRRAQAM
ncbi:hypothetical protein [Nocardia sp. NPDC003963]